MKTQYLFGLMILLISVSNAYIRFKYHNGDEVLRQLQLLNDPNAGASSEPPTYVLFFYNDPGTDRDLRTTNDYFKDRLRSEVLEPEDTAPPSYIYAEVDATDTYGNGYLVDRLSIDREQLKEKPTIVVMRNGFGYVIHGPTAINSVKTSLAELTGESDK